VIYLIRAALTNAVSLALTHQSPQFCSNSLLMVSGLIVTIIAKCFVMKDLRADSYQNSRKWISKRLSCLKSKSCMQED